MIDYNLDCEPKKSFYQGITATRNGLKTEIGTGGGDAAVINLSMWLFGLGTVLLGADGRYWNFRIENPLEAVRRD